MEGGRRWAWEELGVVVVVAGLCWWNHCSSRSERAKKVSIVGWNWRLRECMAMGVGGRLGGAVVV